MHEEHIPHKVSVEIAVIEQKKNSGHAKVVIKRSTDHLMLDGVTNMACIRKLRFVATVAWLMKNKLKSKNEPKHLLWL